MAVLRYNTEQLLLIQRFTPRTLGSGINGALVVRPDETCHADTRTFVYYAHLNDMVPSRFIMATDPNNPPLSRTGC